MSRRAHLFRIMIPFRKVHTLEISIHIYYQTFPLRDYLVPSFFSLRMTTSMKVKVEILTCESCFLVNLGIRLSVHVVVWSGLYIQLIDGHYPIWLASCYHTREAKRTWGLGLCNLPLVACFSAGLRLFVFGRPGWKFVCGSETRTLSERTGRVRELPSFVLCCGGCTIRWFRLFTVRCTNDGRLQFLA